MSDLKPTCCANVPSGDWGRTKKCTFKSKVIEDGKPYCMVHAPSVITKKWEEKIAIWDAEKNARQSARAAQVELERRAGCYDELLEVLKMAVRQNNCDMLMTGEELRKCEAAIAKAEGKQA